MKGGGLDISFKRASAVKVNEYFFILKNNNLYGFVPRQAW